MGGIWTRRAVLRWCLLGVLVASACAENEKGPKQNNESVQDSDVDGGREAECDKGPKQNNESVQDSDVDGGREGGTDVIESGSDSVDQADANVDGVTTPSDEEGGEATAETSSAEMDTEPDQGTDSGVLEPIALPGDCWITYANAWLLGGDRLFVVCDSNVLALLPLDGSDATPVAMVESAGPPSMVTLSDTHVVFRDGMQLKSAALAGEAAAVTLSLEVQSEPLLTSDGQRVVYLADGVEGTATVFASSPVAGGEATTLYAQTDRITRYALAPDGSRAYVLAPDFSLLGVPSAGGDVVNMGRLAPMDLGTDPGLWFTPDAKTLVFTSSSDVSGEPKRLAIGDVDAVPTTFAGAMETGGGGAKRIVFTPDGERMVVEWTGAQLPPPNRFLDSVSIQGGDALPLANADKLRFMGLVGRDSNAALFLAQTGALSPELSVVGIIDGGDAVVLSTLADCALNNPRDTVVVSPDRTQAVYVDAFSDLVLADLDARSSTRLVEAATTQSRICASAMPIWSPDGSKIAYRHCTDESACEIRIVSVDGEALVTLGETALGAVYFSPDSKRAVAIDNIESKVVTFTDTSVDVATFEGDIPLSSSGELPLGSDFSPATFPWIDDTRFVVQLTGTGVTAIVAVDP